MAETHSKRATRFWTRLTQWYGARLSAQYGDVVTDDVAELVDEASNDAVQTVLANLRAKHVTHPPTFLELDQLFKSAKKPTTSVRGQSDAEKLVAWVVRNRDLSVDQLRLPWEHFPGGVAVPAAGGKPGYRVMLEDMAIDRTDASPAVASRERISAIAEITGADWGRMPTAGGW